MRNEYVLVEFRCVVNGYVNIVKNFDFMVFSFFVCLMGMRYLMFWFFYGNIVKIK